MLSTEAVWQRAEETSPMIADGINELLVTTPMMDPEKRWLWLTLPNCGFAVEVLRQQFEREDIASRAVVNWQIETDRFIAHALLEVPIDGDTLYVDPTYLQVFAEFGLDAGLVCHAWKNNGGDILPGLKTLVYSAEQLEDLTDWLAGQTTFLMGKHQHSVLWQERYKEDLRGDKGIPQSIPTRAELTAFFRRLYDPTNLEPFEQAADQQKLVAEYLEDYQPGRISIGALMRHFASKYPAK